jgi:hypothetical protein
MARMQIRGAVLYAPGAWGPAVPVSGAAVEIVDIDEGGNGDDVVFTGTTDGEGVYQGETEEWVDPNKKKLRIFRSEMEMSVPDVLLLKARVSDGPHVQEFAPLTMTGSNVNLLIVNWSPYPIGRVNGQECRSASEIQDRAMEAIQAGAAQVTIQVSDPAAAPLVDLTQTTDQLRTWLAEKLRIDPSAIRRVFGDDSAAALLATTALVRAASIDPATESSAAATSVAIALILVLTVFHDYSRVTAKATTDAEGRQAVQFILDR